MQRGGVSSAKAPLRRGADDWLFMMRDGSRVITLIDQFDKVLDLAGITHNSHGDKYTLYSLRHFYAVLSLRRRIGVFDVTLCVPKTSSVDDFDFASRNSLFLRHRP